MPDRGLAEPDRTARTRAAILDAFTGLAFERRYDAIRIADLTARAGIGRSTFYEHFVGKDAVLLAALHPILLALATAASGRAARIYVHAAAQHLWERRATARPILDSRAAPILQRHLATMMAPHAARAGLSGGEAVLAATGVAAAQLAMLRGWIAGHASLSTDAMADRLIACSALFAPARRPDGAGVAKQS